MRSTLLVGIGTEVRRRRNKLNLSQVRLAKEAGVHVNVVGRIERGVYNPTIMTLDAVATALDASISDLLLDAKKARMRL